MAESIETRQSLPRRKRRREEAHPSTSYNRPPKRSRKGLYVVGRAKKPYIKGSLLGQGSFGSVYAGTRRLDRLPVAIKYATKDEDTVELEVDGQGPMPLEVALMERVNAAPACPNIIQLVKWFDRPTQYIMILERQDTCQDLSVFCAENGRLDESLAKKVLVQLINALKHCESRGVLHRDVKPDNLLICTATHDIKLLDFGCGDLLKDSAYTTFAGPLIRHGEEGQSCVWQADTGGHSISPALASCGTGWPGLRLASWLEAVVSAS